MGDFIFLFVIIVIIGSVIGRISSAVKKLKQDERYRSVDADEQNRRILQAERMRRMQTEIREENKPPYPVPHVAPHTPSVHPMNENPECDAHRKPLSSEGSSVRAHLHTNTDSGCDVHSEPVSSEGESRKNRQERLLREKAEREKHDAFLNRYDEVDKQNIRDAHIRKPRYVKTTVLHNKNAVLQGIIYSEILNPPISRRSYKSR